MGGENTMSNMAVTTAVAVVDLQTIRGALQGVLRTHRGTSKRALEAIQKGREAYGLCFTLEERQRVLEAARAQQVASPAGHYMRQVQIGSFDEVLKELGTQFIDQVLGPQGGR